MASTVGGTISGSPHSLSVSHCMCAVDGVFSLQRNQEGLGGAT